MPSAPARPRSRRLQRCLLAAAAVTGTAALLRSRLAAALGPDDAGLAHWDGADDSYAADDSESEHERGRVDDVSLRDAWNT